jgi:hypothetical protein
MRAMEGRSSAATQATVICVLGMSRSGTSLSARILDRAGVYLGAEEDLLGGELNQIPGEDRDKARAANPEGFWEHYRLMRLNERILHRLGGNWRQPPPLAPGWERSPHLDEEREEARALIEGTFAGRDLWGWKDPRNSLTLPFWQRLLPRMRYVVCLRNPLDVAASLQRRDGISLEHGAKLWLAYVAWALVNTSGRPRLLLAYESYFRDPDGVAARLAAFAGGEHALGGGEAARRLVEAIDKRLWRNRSDERQVIGDRSLPPQLAPLYLLTEALAARAPEGGEGGGEDVERLHLLADLYAEELLERAAVAGSAQRR